MFQTQILQYLRQHGFQRMDTRTVMFDMDGVLFDSMPNHSRSWNLTMEHFGFHLSESEAYMHEGRTGASTINILSNRERGHDATPEEIEEIYGYKSMLFNACPPAEPMQGANDVIAKVKASGLPPVLVTGSGQRSLLDKINLSYPNVFSPEHLVTAFDVVHGKPDPEPYRMGLKKGGHLHPYQSIIIENAPLGVEAGVAAGVFTIAVNTGPLPDHILLDAGANLLFHSMQELATHWDSLYAALVDTQA
jgi:beta-phosphoglucomutase-like phosphatase (HAD superfamily)